MPDFGNPIGSIPGDGQSGNGGWGEFSPWGGYSPNGGSGLFRDARIGNFEPDQGGGQWGIEPDYFRQPIGQEGPPQVGPGQSGPVSGPGPVNPGESHPNSWRDSNLQWHEGPGPTMDEWTKQHVAGGGTLPEGFNEVYGQPGTQEQFESLRPYSQGLTGPGLTGRQLVGLDPRPEPPPTPSGGLSSSLGEFFRDQQTRFNQLNSMPGGAQSGWASKYFGPGVPYTPHPYRDEPGSNPYNSLSKGYGGFSGVGG